MRRIAPALHAAGAMLAEFRRLAPSALLDGPGWDRVPACAPELPDAGPATCLGDEFRLGEDTPAADLFLVVRPASSDTFAVDAGAGKLGFTSDQRLPMVPIAVRRSPPANEGPRRFSEEERTKWKHRMKCG